jgi:hypothetical protein
METNNCENVARKIRERNGIGKMTYDRGKNYWQEASEDEGEWKRQVTRRSSYFPRRIDGRRKDKEGITRYAVCRGLQFAESCTEAKTCTRELIKAVHFPVN